jgi:hypothetical protein
MRINVYSQELTKEVVLVEKTSSNGQTHYGVRMYLASPDILDHTADDDDRSAVTFWLPNCGSFKSCDLADVFGRARALCYDAGAKQAALDEHLERPTDKLGTPDAPS